jgi:hypothetical protein
MGRTTGEAGVVLTYEAIHGRSPELSELVSELKQFAVDDWLCQLARLSLLLAGANSRNPKWANAFLHGFTPSHLCEKVDGWFGAMREKGITTTVPSEREVGILIELAVLHSPPDAPRRMEFPQDSQVVFDSLLMVASLSQPKLEGRSDGDFGAAFASIWIWPLCPDPLTVAMHGYRLFEILEPERSSQAAKWANAFSRSTRQDLDEYLHLY